MATQIVPVIQTEVNAESSVIACECADCHQPMEVQQQPRLVGEGFHTLVTCRNRACDLRNVTLPVGEYAAKTTADFEAYREVNRRNRWLCRTAGLVVSHG